MNRLFFGRGTTVTLLVVAAFTICSVTHIYAVSPVKLHKWIAMTNDLAEGIAPLEIEGTASHLGKFRADGEISFRPGLIAGSSVGEGVVVFVAANGDLLAGVVTLDISPEADGQSDVQMHISWRDSVEFSDGAVFPSTGRFANDRPPGITTLGTASHVWISIPLCIVPKGSGK